MKTGSKLSPHTLRSSIIRDRNCAVSLVEPSGRKIFLLEFFPNNPRTDFFSSYKNAKLIYLSVSAFLSHCPTLFWMIKYHFLSSFSIGEEYSARAEYSNSQSVLQPPITGLVWM